jgi:hypothetical protein
MNEELNRLMILLEATYQQIAMVKFDTQMGFKQKLQTLDVQIGKITNAVRKTAGKEGEDYFDLMSILTLETVREVTRCSDPKVAVSMLQALNEGLEITIDGVKIQDYNPPGSYREKQKIA